VNTAPDKSLKARYFSAGKRRNLVLFSSGKSCKTELKCMYDPGLGCSTCDRWIDTTPLGN